LPLAGATRAQGRDRRFCARHGTLVANTVPLVQSIAIAAGTLNNKMIAAAMSGVAQA